LASRRVKACDDGSAATSFSIVARASRKISAARSPRPAAASNATSLSSTVATRIRHCWFFGSWTASAWKIVFASA
jgi:hypothetical protein